jgi:hypothetical protein
LKLGKSVDPKPTHRGMFRMKLSEIRFVWPVACSLANRAGH